MPEAAPLTLRAFDPARPGDRAAVLAICVRTGDAGRDATALHPDPRVLTDRWAAPYLDLEPELAVLAELDGDVLGYVLGTADTARFAERFAAHPSSLTADERKEHAAGLISPEAARLPAHLHIDLLPAAQGRGAGRSLIEAFVAALPAGTAGVHLVVDPANTGAQAFYPRVGFRELRRDAHGVVFGRELAGDGVRAAAGSGT
ncbi:GNAT family N-acetyltransferase [Herbiconiux sp. CPCC 205716]|uniref:GNAT family N-acetyltransferase n=1 Tax=Herbiconiux gentiana TaxID=2970912 RepID=A0ABT2GC73_9MICO|nr:GNAT family N-acetyltransferase [Herbiconiux gentiana]MCS5713803.1 GNAT family N-acetyltransferase [Herbiconiux gentiana]